MALVTTKFRAAGRPWRLFLTLADEALSGSENMALDVELARAAEPEDPPVLRLFQWRPWAISLGYHQSLDEIDVDRCRADGIDIVRRPTGGRAILHAEELTYSVILPKGCGVPVHSTASTYRLISQALVDGLRRVGVEATFGRSARVPYQTHVPCFATTALYEVQWRGRKLVGSAQRRYENAVLQHGSILLGDAHLRLADYVRGAGENGERRQLRQLLQQRTATVSQAAGTGLSVSELVDALLRGFEATLGANFTPGALPAKTSGRTEWKERRFFSRGGIHR